MKKGEIISVEVVGIAPYGIFIKYNDYKGLIHISELSDRYITNIYDFASTGDIISAYILKVDEEEKKLTLSYKKCKSKKRLYVGQMDIAFKSLEDNLDNWIKNALSGGTKND